MDERTWESMFCSVMEDSGIPDFWILFQDANLKKEGGFVCYSQTTHGRFQCSLCRRHWSSSEVSILFLLQHNQRNRSGTVRMRIFRQQCNKCNDPMMETPKIHIQNIERAVRNLVNKIIKKFYRGDTGTEELKPMVNGKSDGPHDTEHCEACQDGVCTLEESVPTGFVVGAVALSAIALGIGAVFALSQEKKQKK